MEVLRAAAEGRVASLRRLLLRSEPPRAASLTLGRGHVGTLGMYAAGAPSSMLTLVGDSLGVPAWTGVAIPSPLQAAVKNGHEDVVRVLWDEGQVSSRDLQQAVMVAVSSGRARMVEILVAEYGASVEASSNHESPLGLAAKMGFVEVVETLLHLGASARGRDCLALHAAVAYGHVEVVRVLLGHQALVDCKDPETYRTPLRIAAEQGRTMCGELLIQYGADIHAFHTMAMKTPLHWASMNGHKDFVQLLLSLGADMEAVDRDKRTPLLLAVERGHSECIKLLVNMGAILTTRDRWLRLPIHIAAKAGHAKSIRALIREDADINAQDFQHWTPLHHAADKNHVECIHELLQHSANVNALSDDNCTPLDEAVRSGSVECATVLIQGGANLNPERGTIPLHTASVCGQATCVKLLLDCGAKVDAVNVNEQTALHLAADRGYRICVQVLLENDADIDAPDEDGCTPLHIAASSGKETIVRILLTNGANPELRDKRNRPPYHCAADFELAQKAFLVFRAEFPNKWDYIFAGMADNGNRESVSSLSGHRKSRRQRSSTRVSMT